MTSFPKATRTSRPRLAAITIVALTMIMMIIASPCLAQDDGPSSRRGFRGARGGAAPPSASSSVRSSCAATCR